MAELSTTTPKACFKPNYSCSLTYAAANLGCGRMRHTHAIATEATYAVKTQAGISDQTYECDGPALGEGQGTPVGYCSMGHHQ
jgi:hypothetical protein